MASPEEQEATAYDFERAERFYTKLRARVVAWLEGRPGLKGPAREYMLLLPDLFALIVRLIGDSRIDSALKVQLIAVSAYVISPIDLAPDFLLPVGLIDDVVAIAFVLSRVVRIMEEAGEEILREHWEGEGDVLAQVQGVAGRADEVLNSVILRRLRRMFSKGGR